ncbi:low temperature requirement protein A [Micromonospora sp. WMMA1363]|uniref:low temperature requirement protein A n=1 Tax=Micromonospora sp. WMMA1363 TaxID=3053985 RepID=UPI00259D1F0A|nr:low temperature requirement protein A [Micromonospora sp. WMMA1363]MDM4723245.1 low temperature requirement protein A [Micromonospora sp. WMMA1363]
MATSRATALLRKPGQPQQATFLELFFDLVFVFALTRVSQRLAEDLTAQRQIVLTETGQTLLLLLALLMVWFTTAWVTDLFDPDRPEIELLVFATMLGSLVMAVAIPEAFGTSALAFAGAYVAIHVGRGLVLVVALRGHEAQRRAAVTLAWYGVSAVPWLVGALFFPESPARGALWALAIVIDYAGATVRFPTLRRAERPIEAPIVAEHLSERYRQFFIVALGELILVTGATFSGSAFEIGQIAAFVVSFATTALMWRIYIHKAGELLPLAIATARVPSRLAGLSTPAHLLMVAGIVAIAVGDELVIEHPTGHTDSAWVAVILGGPALFLTGRAIFEYAVFGRVSPSRTIGAVVLAAVSPVMVFTPPLVVLSVPALVLAAIAVSDTVRARRRPPEMPTPPL